MGVWPQEKDMPSSWMKLMEWLAMRTGVESRYDKLTQDTSSEYWLRILAQNTGSRYWIKILAQDISSEYWLKILAQDTGSGY